MVLLFMESFEEEDAYLLITQPIGALDQHYLVWVILFTLQKGVQKMEENVLPVCFMEVEVFEHVSLEHLVLHQSFERRPTEVDISFRGFVEILKEVALIKIDIQEFIKLGLSDHLVSSVAIRGSNLPIFNH